MNPFAWLSSLFGRGGDVPQGPVHFDVAAATDRGLVRTDNQDSYLMRRDEFFLAVADGMGGGADGALASAWICEEFAKMLTMPPVSFRERLSKTGAALAAANARIRAYIKERGIKMMGSTAAVLMADPSRPTRGAIAHVGDSRIYRWRKGFGKLLTRDHTVGDELPVHGESYDYPDNFDIIVLRDGVAVKIRDRKVSEIIKAEKYKYSGVPIVNGRGLEVLAKSEEEVRQFLDEYNNSDEGSLRAFAAKWLKFETYRRITMNIK